MPRRTPKHRSFAQPSVVCAFNADLFVSGIGSSLVRYPAITKVHTNHQEEDPLDQECKGNSAWLGEQRQEDKALILTAF